MTLSLDYAALSDVGRVRRNNEDSAYAGPHLLMVADGPQAGVGATLVDEPVIIGRGSDCQIRLDDDYSSTRHSRLFQSEGQWWVEDLGSTNGTYLDGQRVTRPVPAEIGGSIRIGRTTLNIAK